MTVSEVALFRRPLEIQDLSDGVDGFERSLTMLSGAIVGSDSDEAALPKTLEEVFARIQARRGLKRRR
jgi:hypothetical protein